MEPIFKKPKLGVSPKSISYVGTFPNVFDDGDGILSDFYQYIPVNRFEAIVIVNESGYKIINKGFYFHYNELMLFMDNVRYLKKFTGEYYVHQSKLKDSTLLKFSTLYGNKYEDDYIKIYIDSDQIIPSERFKYRYDKQYLVEDKYEFQGISVFETPITIIPEEEKCTNIVEQKS